MWRSLRGTGGLAVANKFVDRLQVSSCSLSYTLVKSEDVSVPQFAPPGFVQQVSVLPSIAGAGWKRRSS